MHRDTPDAADAGPPSLRRRVFAELDPTARRRVGLSVTNRIVCGLILGASLLSVLETEPRIASGYEPVIEAIESALYAIFAVEYALRVWSSAENPRYGPGLAGRLRYMRTPAALLDLAALLPALIIWSGGDAFLFRLFRLLRILTLARLGRFSDAAANMGAAIRARSHELVLSIGIAVLLLIVTSTLLYLAEGVVQPEAFGSIPRAMWWSVATLTTVGYGDVFPVTALGRVLAAATAVTGIGLIAMPAGILAAAFSDAMRSRSRERSE
ncbi:MAG: potassium channel family protein [Alphaproteobacteria bacterium]